MEEMKAAGMSLGQAENYKLELERKLKAVYDFIYSTNNFYKTTIVHFRKKYNPEAEDEIVIEPKQNNMICKPMQVVSYMEDVLWEIEKLTIAIEEAKRKMEAEFENPLFWENDIMYRRMQQALKKLLDVEEKTADKMSKFSEIKIPDFLKNSNKSNGNIQPPSPSNLSIPRPPMPPRPSVSPYSTAYPRTGEWKSEKMCTDYKLNMNGEQLVYHYKVERKLEPEFEKAEVKAVLEKYQDKVRKLTDLKKQKEQEMRVSYSVKYPKENTLEDDLRIFLLEM